MDILFLGIEPRVASLLKRHVGKSAPSRVRVQSISSGNGANLASNQWDVIILDGTLRSHPHLAEPVKNNRLEGLKIVLTDKDDLHSAIEEWGTDVYSYVLKPINRELFQLVWQNAVERIQLSKKASRLTKLWKKHRAGAIEHQDAVKSLFTTHLKLQEMNQEKTNFLAQTSHEMLTPLTALQGYLQLLANGKTGPVNDLQLRIVNSSLSSCGRLLRLAHSLTELGASEQNAPFLQVQIADVRDCLTRSLCELEQKIKAKKINLDLEVAEHLPRFRFDFDRMQQVFVNLIENATKFTAEGGTIRVRCTLHFWDRRTVREMVYAQNERRGTARRADFNSVCVVVEDTGIGIPSGFLQDIFEQYSRVSNEDGTPRGFGLGLSVARRIVLAHQGAIWAESTPAHGSAFTVLIPIEGVQEGQ